MMGRFYVYIYQDPRTHVPFYVGKGSGSRKKWFHCHGWCQRKLRNFEKKGLKPEIVTYAENLSEEEAFSIEIELIAKYGRRDIGTGILLNNTNGGEGTAGVKLPPMSDEHRRRLSEARRGKPGHPHTEEFKKRLSERLKGKPKTKEHNLKVSLAKKGKKLTDVARRHLSEAWNGRASLEKAHNAASIVWTGRKHSEATKLKIAAARRQITGWHHSEETRRKISESNRLYYQNKIQGEV